MFPIAPRFGFWATRALALASLGCLALAGHVGAQASLPTITSSPVLVPNSNTNVPLAATITLQTDVPTRITLLVDDGVRIFLIPDAEPAFRIDHEVPVLGLAPGRTHAITVIAIDVDNEQTPAAVPLTFVTPPLPANFPPITVNSIDPARVEPGYTILAPRFSTPGGGPAGQWTVILDDQGQVVWYMEGFAGGERVRNGDFLFGGVRNASVVQKDILGNTVHEWYASRLDGGAGAPPGAILVDTDSLHHDLLEMPAGADSDYVALSSELRVLTDYPNSEADPSQTSPTEDVIGDVIVEFNLDGRIIRQKNLLDILDPYRIGYGGLEGGFWNSAYGTVARDWTHGNALVYDPRDDTYVVSLRHQDCIVKIRRDTPGTGSPDDIVWILGNHEGWRSPWNAKLLTPTGPQYAVNSQGKVARVNELEFEWQYHQHSVLINSRGNVVCFDNGNYRVSPPETAAPQDTWYSRAVEYHVSLENMSVRQVWTAGGQFDVDPTRLGYSRFVSNAEPQPLTGNLLVNGGGTVDSASNTFYIHLQELTRTKPPVSVLDITVRQPLDDLNWNSFRARRIDRIYSRPLATDALQLHIGSIDRMGVTQLLGTGDARPGETVWFAYSEVGSAGGDCYYAGNLCLDLESPFFLMGTARVGRDGTATLAVPVPPQALSGQVIHFQALILRRPHSVRSVTSNALAAVIR